MAWAMIGAAAIGAGSSYVAGKKLANKTNKMYRHQNMVQICKGKQLLINLT